MKDFCEDALSSDVSKYHQHHGLSLRELSTGIRVVPGLRMLTVTRTLRKLNVNVDGFKGGSDLTKSAIQIATRNPNLREFTLRDVLPWDHLDQLAGVFRTKHIGRYRIEPIENHREPEPEVRHNIMVRPGRLLSHTFISRKYQKTLNGANTSPVNQGPSKMPFTSTLGITLLGILVACVLFGLFTAQVYIYHKNFPNESRWIRFGLVDGMWLIELGHTMCLFHLVYYYAIVQFGVPNAIMTSAPPSFAVSIFFHGAVAVLGPPYYIPVICLFLMTCQLSLDMVVGVKAAIIAGKSVEMYLTSTKWLILAPLVLRAVVDIIISVTLVYCLLYQRSASAFKNTTAVIDKLILWSIGNVLWCPSFLFRELKGSSSMLGVAYLHNVENYTWVALYVVFPKVFSNTMLANMNHRVVLRKMQSALILSGGLDISNVRSRSMLQFNHSTDNILSPTTPSTLDTPLDSDKIRLGLLPSPTRSAESEV
ncbi:hypothetical protein BDP27DRAFT_1423930 [Rhodocollybia butyracea]|uniref:DUF6534 domain-containing protein n=1 Tax=Rhodocollybia butyracea TaxID=206335 RepID=A0A9P5U631_9AGAR|nr:hypothetical protein BDP27DRAFT_1423930 [Rhodocollybia butyracea]